MSITIQLPPESEAKLQEKARQQGKTPEEYLANLAHKWLNESSAPEQAQLPADQWIARFRAWAGSHEPAEHFVDDSRESIYAGRGE